MCSLNFLIIYPPMCSPKMFPLFSEFKGAVIIETNQISKFPSVMLQSKTVGGLLTCPTSHYSDISLVRQVYQRCRTSEMSVGNSSPYLTSQLSDISIVRQHLSTSFIRHICPVVRHAIPPTSHLCNMLKNRRTHRLHKKSSAEGLFMHFLSRDDDNPRRVN